MTRSASLSSSDLGQGDSDNIQAELSENGVPTDLSFSTVVFHMKSELGAVYHEITCMDSGLTVGKCTLPINSTYSSQDGLFFGQFVATRQISTDYYFGDGYFGDGYFCEFPEIHGTIQKTFPSIGYLIIKIEKAI